MDYLETIRNLIVPLVPNTFIGTWPSEKVNAVSLRWGGGTRVIEHFGDSSYIQQSLITVMVRHSDYDTGEQWVGTIQGLLSGYSAGNILQLRVATPPSYLGINQEKYHQFRVIFKSLIRM